MGWDIAVYTSELGYLLDLPFFFYRDPSKIRQAAFVIRLLINAVAISLISYDTRFYEVGGIMLATTLALHLSIFVRNKAFKKPQPIDEKLYWIAHVSITNFLLDTPGRNIKTVRISHAILVVFSIIPVAILLFTWFLITPIETAWACYDPAYINSVEDYKYGTCAFNDMCTLPQINCDKKAKILHTEFHYAIQLFIFLFIIQITSVPSKVTWYKLKELGKKTL